MSIFGGGGKGSGPTRINDLAVQTSSLGVTLTKGWGTNRIKGNLMWYGAFKSVGKTQKQGGKGSVKTTTYTYFASIIMGLASGPIQAIPTVYRDKETKTPAQLGLGVMLGNLGQAPWSYMTSSFPSQALGYSGIAYVYASNYGLSDSATLQNHSFEVKFGITYGALPDANPKDIIVDFFTNVNSGLPGWPAGLLADYTDYSNYCLASGLLLSPVLESQMKASEFLTDQIIEATNSDIFWSEGLVKIKPRGDTTVTGNSITWVPDLTPVYDLNEDDFLDPEDPVTQEIIDQSDAYNKVQIEYLDRTNQYNAAIEPGFDLTNIIEYGERKEDPKAIHSICDKAVANKVANLRLQRKLYIREQYKFRVDDSYILLEQGDYITLTTTTDKLQLDRLPVRLLEIEEDEDGNYTMTAEAVMFNTASAALYDTHPSFGYIADTGVSPGNVTTPSLLNAPTTLTDGVAELWIGAASDNVNWGGCEVWGSVDGTNYSQMGLMSEPSRYGSLTTSLAAAADPQPAGSFTVDLGISLGILSSVSDLDRDTGTTLAMIDQEVISYKTATLVSGNTYTISNLRRGLYGTPIQAHSIGARFTRLDSEIFRLPYVKLGYKAVSYFKFLSFNIWGYQKQELSDVSAYTVTALPTIITANDIELFDPFNYKTGGDLWSMWNYLSSTPNAPMIPVVSGDLGGGAVQVGNSTGSDNFQGTLRQAIAFDPEDLYVVEWDVDVVAGSATSLLYLGIAALDVNGANLPSSFGTYHYIAASGLNQSVVGNQGRKTYRGYFRGTSTSGNGNPSNSTANPTTVPTATVKVAPLVLANWAGNNGKVILHEMRIRKLSDVTAVPYLTNEAIIVTSDYAGTTINYTGANGQFVIKTAGGVDVSNLFTFATAPSGNPQALTVAYSGVNVYTITGAGSAAGQFGNGAVNQANLTIRATGTGVYAGVVFDKLVQVTKSRAAQDGSPAKMIVLSSDNQTINYTPLDEPVNPSGLTTFKVNRQNSAATVVWTIKRIQSGTAVSISGILTVAGDTLSATMTDAAFDTACATEDGIVVTTTMTDGTVLSDSISIVKVPYGAEGGGGYVLINEANSVVTPNTIKKTVGAGWNQAAYTSVPYRAGAQVLADVDTSLQFMVALAEDPTKTVTNEYEANTYAVYNDTTTFRVYSNGAQIGTGFGTIANGEKIGVTYNNYRVEFFSITAAGKRVVRYSMIPYEANSSLFGRATIYTATATINNFQFSTIAPVAKSLYVTSDRQNIGYIAGVPNPSLQTTNLTAVRPTTNGIVVWSAKTTAGAIVQASSYINGTAGVYNQLLYSQTFINAAWAASSFDATVTANSAVAPDGTQTADTLTDSSATNLENRQQNVTITANAAMVVAVLFVKKTSTALNFFGWSLALTGGTTVVARGLLNTNSGEGALTTDSSGSGVSFEVEDYDEYWRFTVRCTNNSTNTTAQVAAAPAARLISSGIAGNYVGTLTGSAIVWGAMMMSSHLSYGIANAYVETEGVAIAATVNSNSDTASITAANFNTAKSTSTGLMITGTILDGYVLRDTISLVTTSDGATGDPGLTVPAASPAAFTVTCFNDGTVKSGQFNKTSQLRVLFGTTDVTNDAGTTWSAATQTGCTGTMSNTIGTKGLLTFTGISADNGSLSGTVTYAGQTVNWSVPISKVRDGTSPAPAYPPEPTDLATTVYPTIITLNNGQTCTVMGKLRCINPTGGGTLNGQLQYSVYGSGTWTNVTGTPTDSDAYNVGEVPTVHCNGTFTNSTGDALNYQVRFIGSKTGAGAVTVDESGSYMQPGVS